MKLSTTFVVAIIGFLASSSTAKPNCKPGSYACGTRNNKTGIWQCTADGSHYVWHNWCPKWCWLSKGEMNVGCLASGDTSQLDLLSEDSQLCDTTKGCSRVPEWMIEE